VQEHRNATRYGWRLLRRPKSDTTFGYQRYPAQSVSGSFVHLPVVRLRCSMKLAYQATDAGHPLLGRASSPPSQANIVQRFCSYQGCAAAKAHLGKDII